MNFSIKSIAAHCDIPCGVYETETLKTAAQTCLNLVDKILALDKTKLDQHQKQNYQRYVQAKEEHAQICKQQIYILWSDYFKPSDYSQYPDLSQKLWLATQTCSQIKQTLDRESVCQLINQIKAIDLIFSQTQR